MADGKLTGGSQSPTGTGQGKVKKGATQRYKAEPKTRG